MNLFQEFFVTAMVILIFSCIIVKFVSAAVSKDGRVDKEKIVVEEVKISKGLIVRSRKSKKRVKFVEEGVVGNVDRVEREIPNKDGIEGFVEKKIEGVLRKGEDFKGEKGFGNLDLVEHCGGEREVEIEGVLKKGDDFKGEKVCESLELIEQCGGEREMSDGHDDADMCGKIGLMEEKDEVKKIDELLVVKEKDTANAVVVDEAKVGENEVVEVGGGLSKGDDEKTDKMAMDEDSDDDWEGIERSELEEEFVKAVNFVDGGNGKNSSMENLGSELMMQLYGLQKIAMEGPCHEPQPMALKVYARAKWNAWQKMGSMNQEVAMEQYIKLLSDHVPEWTHHSKDDCEVGSSETKMHGDPDPISDSSNDTGKDERTHEMNRAAEGDEGEKE
ncbi:acyl-CoA-binding domain-containing protein 3 isoform X2 [Solanum verrucosum]|uniref:acyl-CoA-binding domain-containing protein 3 isoform X2 n=1 Tax=Solanum verrucosum TaxID=315347 RepID=UPI0020D1BAB1|nr:acyl-CoA-binding domain-containing protein 3 isoform X2 [Solanum verrucosum]